MFKKSPGNFLDIITLRLKEILEEKKQIELTKTWKKHSLINLKNLYDINSHFFELITGEKFKKKWN